MKGMDVLLTLWRHLPLEMESKVVGQEVTSSQSRSAVQCTLTNIQADSGILKVLKQLKTSVESVLSKSKTDEISTGILQIEAHLCREYFLVNNCY